MHYTQRSIVKLCIAPVVARKKSRTYVLGYIYCPPTSRSQPWAGADKGQKIYMRQTRIERVTFRLPRILDRTESLQSDALPTELLALDLDLDIASII
jgi:hypothetical protein